MYTISIDLSRIWCPVLSVTIPFPRKNTQQYRSRLNYQPSRVISSDNFNRGNIFKLKIDPDLVKYNYQRRDSYAFFHFLSNNIKAKKPVADARMIVDFGKEGFSLHSMKIHYAMIH